MHKQAQRGSRFYKGDNARDRNRRVVDFKRAIMLETSTERM